MRVFLQNWLLSSLIILLLGGFQIVNAQKVIEPPLLQGNTSALYKVNIEVFGNHFSGLALFKKADENQSYNIVLMSELGLTLCEFYATSDNIEVRKASAMFQSDMAIKVLKEDFGYLIKPIVTKRDKKNHQIKTTDKSIYTIEDNKVTAIKKRRLINGVKVGLSYDDKEVPSEVSYKHSGVKFKMNLKLVKLK